MKIHQSLPVSGYRPQSADKVAQVNEFKADEERILRKLDALKGNIAYDQRWLATGRTQLEKAFMSINRSVFAPTRVVLPEDEAPNKLSAQDLQTFSDAAGSSYATEEASEQDYQPGDPDAEQPDPAKVVAPPKADNHDPLVEDEAA